MHGDDAPSDRQLFELATRVGVRLAGLGLRAVTAESCTGGWVAKALTDVAGSSGWFDGGFVTYANAAKMRDLGVRATTLEAQGAVSESVVREMAAGALAVTGAGIAIAVSGIAGPGGGSPAKPVGSVWFGLARAAPTLKVEATLRRFTGDRERIRRAAVALALELLLSV
jgi:nicotinamide-nucleotide amidase